MNASRNGDLLQNHHAQQHHHQHQQHQQQQQMRVQPSSAQSSAPTAPFEQQLQQQMRVQPLSAQSSVPATPFEPTRMPTSTPARDEGMSNNLQGLQPGGVQGGFEAGEIGVEGAGIVGRRTSGRQGAHAKQGMQLEGVQGGFEAGEIGVEGGGIVGRRASGGQGAHASGVRDEFWWGTGPHAGAHLEQVMANRGDVDVGSIEGDGWMEGECLNSGGMPGPSQVSYWGISFRVANIRKHSLLHPEVKVAVAADLCCYCCCFAY